MKNKSVPFFRALTEKEYQEALDQAVRLGLYRLDKRHTEHPGFVTRRSQIRHIQ